MYRSRAAGLVCAVSLGVSAHSLIAEEGGFMKPLPDGWWHLSMEDIRAGEDRELARDAQGAVGPARTPHLDLKDSAKPGQSRKSKILESVFSNELKTEGIESSDTETSKTGRETRLNVPHESSGETTRDTTLRDYTTATTRALQKSDGSGTNLFRAMSPTLPVKNIDVGLFNRAQDPAAGGATGAGPAKLDKDPIGKSTTPSTADVMATLPGSSYYSVPSSPLDVVNSSFANPQIQSLPTQSAAAPNSPNSLAKPTEAGELNPKPSSLFAPALTTGNPTLPAGTTTTANPTTPGGTSTAKASAPTTPQSIGWVPAAYPQQGFQPAGAGQPLPNAIRRSSGPNANGFYEPKSISDLQMGR